MEQLPTKQTNNPSTPTYTGQDDLTPQLSSASPDTPTKKDRPYPSTILQTPTSRMKGYSTIGVGAKPDDHMATTIKSVHAPVQDESQPRKEVEGLGYGIDIDEGMIDVSAEMDRREGSSSSSREIVLGESGPEATGSTVDVTVPEIEAEEREVEFPSLEEMKVMQDRLSGSDVAKEDLVDMVKTLLGPCMEQLPVLRDQLDAQVATIKTLQHQAKLASQLGQLERDRHSAERTGWHREMKALSSARDREIAAGKRPRKGLDLDVGYHQELEASNKRLEMDNRLMAPRLADTQRQIDKLVNELRHLRSTVIMSTAPIDTSHATPSRQSQRRKSVSPSRAIFNATTMGDARSEHLLLAARKVRSMRQGHPNVGMLTLSELKRNGVVGPEGGLGYSEGYGHGMEDSEDDSAEEFMEGEDELDEDRKPIIQHSRKASTSTSKPKNRSNQNTPQFPKAKKGTKQNLPCPPTTPRSRKQNQGPPPTTTPGGSNFSDLLRAAELATRPETPKGEGRVQVPMPMSAMSATRTRMREESVSERGSPVKKARRVEGDDSQSAQAEGADASALDILAQASQLDVAQGDTPEAEPLSYPEPSQQQLAASQSESTPRTAKPPSPTSSVLEPPIDLYQSDPRPPQTQGPSEQPTAISTPLHRPRNLSISQLSEIQTPRYTDPGHGQYIPQSDPPAGAYQSPQGGTVPGLGKYVHLSSSMPARRVRSPYLKWTIEEDELLARAVAIHGEKWDLVSKGVPTRSYHQVRQRWLRKTGAFDKKQSQPNDHHGNSNLGLGFGMPLSTTTSTTTGTALGMGTGMGLGMGMAIEEDREGSPTPQSGRGKKRRGSADE